MEALLQCCRNCKISPQDERPLEAKQEPSPKFNRIGPSQLPRVSFVSTDTANTGDTSGSTRDSLNSSTTLPSVESEHPILLDEKIIANTMQLVKAGDKDFQNNEENITFLHAISTWCMDALRCGQDTLGLPFSKAELTEAIVMMMESLPIHSVPSSLLSCSMLAIYNLSKMKPPYESELESCILRLAFHGVFSMDTHIENPHSVALYQSSSDTMEIMLKTLLTKLPTTSHLLFIMDHINFWIRSRDFQERSRAIKCCSSLLQHAVFLLDLDASGDLPAMGHHVAQIGICITDSMDDVSHYARVAISCLYELLLCKMGQCRNDTRKLWCQETDSNRMVLDYLDTCRVGEVFRNVFTQEQKNAFLQTALRALYDPFLRISEAGILLVYSLLGKGKELVGDEVETTRKLIFRQLHKLRTQKVVPDALKTLFPS
ncbi:hypothetical protein lerEdw1_002828 [Lerista edwardsae]|nr:hypothetical protein lerEdw1_002828 [Lerista edwardsae]